MGTGRFDPEAALRRHFAAELDAERRSNPEPALVPESRRRHGDKGIPRLPRRAFKPPRLPAEATAAALLIFFGAAGFWSQAHSAPPFMKARAIELGSAERLALDLGAALGEAAEEYRDSPPSAVDGRGFSRFR